MTCASCSNTVTDVVSAVPGVEKVFVSLIEGHASVVIQSEKTASHVLEAISDAGFEAQILSVTAPNGPFDLSLSVEGMTCASCSNTITSAISAVPGVEDVSVSFIDGHASVRITVRDVVQRVLEAVSDAGYEAQVVSVTAVRESLMDVARNVTFRVDGLYCRHCPKKIMDAVAATGVDVVTPLTDFTNPILAVRYLPDPPRLSIRSLMTAIAKANDPPFSVTMHKPPSIEELARQRLMRETRTLLLRLSVAVVAAVPAFVLGTVYMSLVSQSNSTRKYIVEPMWAGNVSRVQWALFFIATPVMFFSAWTFHRRSLREIYALWRPGSVTPLWRRFVRFGSMSMLVSAGVSVAYFSSIALLALGAVQAPSATGEGDTSTYFDSVVLLTMFLLAGEFREEMFCAFADIVIGRFLESYSKSRTADAVNALVSLRPQHALIATQREITSPGTRLREVSVDMLDIGDIVRVPHGSSPPADGIVSSDDWKADKAIEILFDESSLTGEARAVVKQPGDEVFAGTVNVGPVVSVRIKAVGGQTMLDKIVQVVREGQARRAPLERYADVITAYFVPVVTLLAIITWVIWFALGESGALPKDSLDIPVGGWPVWSLEFAIALFVIACPCGIGLAAPTALLVGSGLAAKFGILARGGGEAFQEMAKTQIIVFDKTGTLTEGGAPRVSDTEISSKSYDKATVLGVAAALEGTSVHPLAKAIRNMCDKEGANDVAATAVREVSGRGVSGHFDALGLSAVIGSEAWVLEHGAVANTELEALIMKWKSEAKSVVVLALSSGGGEGPFVIVATFAVTDVLRPEARETIEWLHNQNIEAWMISGDNTETATAVARMAGIRPEHVIGDVLPTEKADKIRALQEGGRIVAMVGDGINDAPALAMADVGIAVGSGSDVAISSASFILLTSDLRRLVTLRDLSQKTISRVIFNFGWALVYNVAAIPIAAGVIYPAGHARLNPVWASLAMALSSVSVICSSLMLKLYREPKFVSASRT
ncbi:heavy metal translocatin [Fistulina hepatica ATCC 64428]|uniref:Heavy metal translocatin n=1 Tax=Fistulina hepatica ATCC 64428 TaxID=1128425 RepID=A0A0D7A361_9AGAR|nr:heavy metal translocatin [Fistulina hepatica ATCC 64428]